MKKLFMVMLLSVLLLTGCLPNVDQQDEVVTEGENENSDETAIVPKNQISDSYYRTLTPFKPSATRGLTVSNMNSRYNSDELEEGLFRIAQQTFSTDKYIFQEGQYIDKETVTNWLGRLSEDNPAGLNPELPDKDKYTKEDFENNPLYLAHILEHNYLVMSDENKVKMSGMAIGLALNTVYYFRTYNDDGTINNHQVTIDQEKMESEGKKIAQTIISRLRQMEGLENITITIGLFAQEDRNSIVPGNYFAYAVSNKGHNLEWRELEERYVLFPSGDAAKDFMDDSNRFSYFQDQVNKYFPDHNGIVGKGLYINDNLRFLSIDITMQFNGKAEVIGFVQYVAGLLVEHYPNISTEVTIKSVNGQEALILFDSDMEEPFVHVY